MLARRWATRARRLFSGCLSSIGAAKASASRAALPPDSGTFEHKGPHALALGCSVDRRRRHL
jgi:hypothetical protein